MTESVRFVVFFNSVMKICLRRGSAAIAVFWSQDGVWGVRTWGETPSAVAKADKIRTRPSHMGLILTCSFFGAQMHQVVEFLKFSSPFPHLTRALSALFDTPQFETLGVEDIRNHAAADQPFLDVCASDGSHVRAPDEGVRHGRKLFASARGLAAAAVGGCRSRQKIDASSVSGMWRGGRYRHCSGGSFVCGSRWNRGNLNCFFSFFRCACICAAAPRNLLVRVWSGDTYMVEAQPTDRSVGVNG